MKNITAKQLRQMWFDFWKKNGHAIISSASGNGAAAMFVSEDATDRQIWITAVGMPMSVTVLIIFQVGRKKRMPMRMTERRLR